MNRFSSATIVLSRQWTPNEDCIPTSTASSESDLVVMHSTLGNVASTQSVGIIEAVSPAQKPQPVKFFFESKRAIPGASSRIPRVQISEERVGAPGATVASLLEWPDLWHHPEKARAAQNVANLISYLKSAELDDWNSIAEAISFSLYLHKAPKKRFDILVRQWKTDVEYLSDATAICTHPAYQHIIGMGSLALPFIFAEMEREDAFASECLYG